MLLTQARLEIAGQAVLLPAVTLCCVWFWSLSRPSALPPPMVFLIGLLMDLLGYLPLGVGALTLLVTQAAALGLRRPLSSRGLILIWGVFAAVAAAASLLIWCMVMLLTFRRLSPDPMIFLAIFTAALFPVLAVPLAATSGGRRRPIVDPERE